MARIPDKRQPFDPARAARERNAAASERPVTALTPAQRLGKRPLLRPEKPLLREED
jgi:hypothetical protein